MELATLLYELPYYHAISSCVIDHMHCLFLGIAKHCFKTWMLNGVLQEDSLIVIRARVDSFNCQAGIGRLPYQIASEVSGLKADQWKKFDHVFFLICMKDILPYLNLSRYVQYVREKLKDLN